MALCVYDLVIEFLDKSDRRTYSRRMVRMRCLRIFIFGDSKRDFRILFNNNDHN